MTAEKLETDATTRRLRARVTLLDAECASLCEIIRKLETEICRTRQERIGMAPSLAEQPRREAWEERAKEYRDEYNKELSVLRAESMGEELRTAVKAERERVLQLIERHQALLDAPTVSSLLVEMSEFIKRICEESP